MSSLIPRSRLVSSTRSGARKSPVSGGGEVFRASAVSSGTGRTGLIRKVPPASGSTLRRFQVTFAATTRVARPWSSRVKASDSPS